jgi:glycosyltransferase involved in cell wall biosynthesis
VTDRVLHVVGPSAGGIRRHVAVLSDGLERRGWDVTVAAPTGVMDGLGRSSIEVPVSLGARAPKAIRSLRPLVRDADVVHAHGLTAGWLAWAAGAADRLVVTVHNLVLDEAAGRSAPLLRRLEGALPDRAREVIVISEQMRRRFDPDGTDEHLVVIPPVGPEPVAHRSRDDVRAELGLDERTSLLVLVGRLHPQKGIGTALDALARLDSGVHLAIVGDGPSRPDIEAQIARLGLVERVHLLGRRDDAADFFAAADVVVVSSIWEGFGLVVAEALHLGRPVVATAVGPIPSMVVDGETGRLVPPSDPVAMASAVDDLLSDPDHAAVLGQAGAKLVRPHFDTDALVGRVEDVYRLVTRNR